MAVGAQETADRLVRSKRQTWLSHLLRLGRRIPMKLGYGLSCLMLAFVALFQGNSASLAQDVAAAARANRANAALVKPGGEAQELVGALKTCVADNTSGKDRKELAKWVFFAMAA